MKSFKEFIKQSENFQEQQDVSSLATSVRPLGYDQDATHRGLPIKPSAQFIGGLTGDITWNTIAQHEQMKKVPQELRDEATLYLKQIRQAIDRIIDAYNSLSKMDLPPEYQYVLKIANGYILPKSLPQRLGQLSILGNTTGDPRLDHMPLVSIDMFLWSPKTRKYAEAHRIIEYAEMENPLLQTQQHKEDELFKGHEAMYIVDVSRFQARIDQLIPKLEKYEVNERVWKLIGKKLSAYSSGAMSSALAGGFQPTWPGLT